MFKMQQEFFSKLYQRCKANTIVGGGQGEGSDTSIIVPAIFQKISSSFKDTICNYKTVFHQDYVLVTDAIESINGEIVTLV